MNRFSNVIARPQNEVAELISNIVIHAAINLAFLVLLILLLWPLGKVSLAFQWAKGYGLFWIVMIVLTLVVSRLQNFFRLDHNHHFDAYVISNLVPSSSLVAGWSAFAALTIQSLTATTFGWVVGVLYVVGLLSSWIAFTITSAFYTGEIYKKVNLVLAVVSFIVFAIWPALGRLLFGWVFHLF